MQLFSLTIGFELGQETSAPSARAGPQSAIAARPAMSAASRLRRRGTVRTGGREVFGSIPQQKGLDVGQLLRAAKSKNSHLPRRGAGVCLPTAGGRDQRGVGPAGVRGVYVRS